MPRSQRAIAVAVLLLGATTIIAAVTPNGPRKLQTSVRV